MITADEARAVADNEARRRSTPYEPLLRTIGDPIDAGDWWAFHWGDDEGSPVTDMAPLYVRKDTGTLDPGVATGAHSTMSDKEPTTMTTTAAAPPVGTEQAPALADDIPTDGPPLHGVLCPEGIRTGDGRSFSDGSMRWRDLPLPLMVQNATAQGHDGAVRAARIDNIWRDDTGPITKVRFDGTWATTSEGELTEVAAAARDEVLSGVLRGVSVDLDDVTVEFLDAETGEPIPEDEETGLPMFFVDPLMNVTDGRISGATMCSIPAFEQAYVADGLYVLGEAEPGDNDATPVGGADAEFVSEKPWGGFTEADYTPEQWRDACLLHLDVPEGEDPLVKSLHKLPVYEPGGALNRAGCHAAASVLGGGRGGVDAPPEKITAAAKALVGLYRNQLDEEPPDSLLAKAGMTPAEESSVAAAFLLASASVPVFAAADFADPGLTEPTPLSITEDGRVFGHLAQWGTCHLSFDGVCITPPHSLAGYAYFTTGEVETDEGPVPVGPITVGTGHAATRLGHRPALAHYDNTGTAVADVVMGEDSIGIWYSGRLRPGATPEQVVALKHGGAVSGDWRRIGGNLELVAALGVNTPGFPMPRVAMAASAGRQVSLVASGIVPQQTHSRSMAEERADARAIMREVLATLDRRQRVVNLTASIGRDKVSRIAAAAALIEEG